MGSNLMGLNLSVDNELMAEAVKETIVASVVAGLQSKDQIIHELVSSLLTERVLTEDGSKPHGYSSERTCTRMEWFVRKAMTDMVKEEIATMIEEQKPALRDMIRKEFQSTHVQSKFVEMFMDSLSMSLTNQYSSKVTVEFEERKDRY